MNLFNYSLFYIYAVTLKLVFPKSSLFSLHLLSLRLEWEGSTGNCRTSLKTIAGPGLTLLAILDFEKIFREKTVYVHEI